MIWRAWCSPGGGSFILFYFFCLLQTPLRLITLSLISGQHFLAHYWSRQQARPRFGWKIFKFYATFFEPRKITCCLVLVSVQPRIVFWLLLPPAHRSTLLRRTFRLISCRNKKIGEEKKSIFRCWLWGYDGSKTGPTWGRALSCLKYCTGCLFMRQIFCIFVTKKINYSSVQVEIRLKDYGASLIEVSDNGSGRI